MITFSSFLLLSLVVTACGIRVHKCSLSEKEFSCFNSSAYVYNGTTGNCNHHNFVCPGTPNSFLSIRKCESYCIETDLPKLCLLPKSAGSCESSFNRYYYNSNLTACKMFIYRGCEGNENNFETLEKCERICLIDRQSTNITTASTNAKRPLKIMADTTKSNNTIITATGSSTFSEGYRTHISFVNVTDYASLQQQRKSKHIFCFDPPLKGECNESIQQYFFDLTNGRCKMFLYSGCGGNSNRFSTRKQCEEICNDPCTDPVSISNCSFSGSALHYHYYNQATDSCVPFGVGMCGSHFSRNTFKTKRQCELSCTKDVCRMSPYVVPCSNSKSTIYYDQNTHSCGTWINGCLGNDNNFTTVQECQNRCMSKYLRCSLPPEQGHSCSSNNRHFYYDVKSKHCERYNEGKCATTSNNFLTHKQCSWMCEENACMKGWTSRPCEVPISRYFYNLTTRECEISLSGQCNSNMNSFESKDHCHERCSLGDICIIPVNRGMCNGSEPRWYFNRKTRRCEFFSYSGCGGNDNNFQTESICKMACTQHPCHTPKDPKKCEIPKNNYYFDSKSGLCFFSNITCFTYGNTFLSFDQCKNTCIVDNPCLAPAEEKSCESTHPRYYYDSKSGQCTHFEYNGCGGNANNYKSIEECNTVCNGVLIYHNTTNVSKSTKSSLIVEESFHAKTTNTTNIGDSSTKSSEDNSSEEKAIIDDESTLFERERKSNSKSRLENDKPTNKDSANSGSVRPKINGHHCLLPLKIGSCDQIFERFFFDMFTHACQKFIYSGCEGNGNNFLTMKECNKTCVNICREPIQIVPSIGSVTRFYYNSTSGMCESLPRNVDNESSNNFLEIDICEKICVTDACLQRKKTGSCRGYMRRFYYDTKTDRCLPFIYGGCQGNGNNFLTSENCEERCRHLSYCFLNPDANTCSTSSQPNRFFYDSFSGNCKPTNRISCGLHANNFMTLQECESHCLRLNPCANHNKIETFCDDLFKFERFYFNKTKGICEKYYTCTASGFKTASSCESQCFVDVCSFPSYHGPCDLDQVRYYYSTESKKCRLFSYGGCYGNKNNFKTMDECISKCDPNICAHPKNIGTCDHHFKRYFYDTRTKTCLPFIYSGCGGNSNNFPTFKSCQNSCQEQKCSQYTGKEMTCSICQLKPEEIVCSRSSSRHRFYYDSSSDRCMNFRRGVCGSENGNSFSTLEECKRTCRMNVCNLPPLQTYCNRAGDGDFYYDQEADTCKSFGKGICGTNQNSFFDRRQCESKCVKDTCHFTMDIGPCEAAIKRFFYNHSSGMCEAFQYGGCGGNNNNFANMFNCEKVCMKDQCKLPSDPGICNGRMVSYYYNSDDGRCHKFIYGGCGGNLNRFNTLADCMKKCHPDPCDLPPDVGPCRERHNRFYYNSLLGKCDVFIYGGCKGNRNNFKTIKRCQQTCLRDPCAQPVKVGPCEAMMERFYFDSSMTGQCKRFNYGGCEANANNFKTIEDCQERCSRAHCTLYPDSGTCNHNITQFYYDMSTGRCLTFTYSGCGGNANRFNSGDLCEKFCMRGQCKLKMNQGSCNKNLRRFFFDHKNGKCFPFLYGGCGGNTNNFLSEEICKRRCLEESPCLQPKISGPCMASFQRFYHDPMRQGCYQFTYGGCQGNRNNFNTREECEETCVVTPHVSKKRNNKCLLPEDQGLCSSPQQRFYYNPEMESCEPFTYNGCAGNANNFLSEGQCERECKFDPCKQEKIVGSCSGNEKRWYFDQASELCQSFTYSGCGSNGNNFHSLENCEQQCIKPACRLDMAVGTCNQNLPRFFYNWEHGRCYEFNYSGCDGNENQFLSLKRCQEACNVGPSEAAVPYRDFLWGRKQTFL